jgi:hypothetical protein
VTTSFETIKGIEEVENIKNATLGVGGGLGNMIAALRGYSGYDGYAVETDKQTIFVLIDNFQSCCESFGYLASEDDLSYFVGAELREIAVVDEALNVRRVDEHLPYGLDEGGITFVNFVTDRGVFQLAAYNAHNGYYGHEVHIISEQLIEVHRV